MSRALTYAAGNDPIVEQSAAPAPTPASPDDYGDKLAKYIPAEVIGFYVAASLSADNRNWVIGFLVTGLLGTLLIQKGNARHLPKKQRPGFWSYVLVAAAYLLWAFGTSEPTSALIDVSPKNAGFVLAAAAFLIPAIDRGFLSKER